ncbi:MAG TPA: AbrB/MazE/SpoVT family DNA-binding domain-containing protein [Candidatus Woesebacteria bacterium]|nr:AbrB/MazE/SpoVT family DNA-binding domain-containing protein [Candidatus Woesebacteria bacterium]
MKIATVSSKGQITIPQDMLKNILNISYGSKVILSPDKNTLTIRPLTQSIVEQTAGSLKKFVDPKLLNISFEKVREETQRIAAEEIVKKI